WTAMLNAQLVSGREYGRSMVISRQGIVAKSHVLASQAGAQILTTGGSAGGGALAGHAALRGSEPVEYGRGGGLFVQHWGCEDWGTDRAECIRTCAARVVAGVLANGRRSGDAARGDPQRHSAGRGGWVGEAPPAARKIGVGETFRWGDCLRRAGVCRQRSARR